MLQGHFSQWTDSLPVIETTWYDPWRHSSLLNITTYRFKNGHYDKHVNKLPINLNKKQPEILSSKNCTAALVTNRYLVWMTISCSEVFEASYICQSTTLYTAGMSMDSLVYNRTCDGGWFMLSGGHKCFSMTWINKQQLSYNEANGVCHSQNASVLIVEAEADVDLHNASSTLIEAIEFDRIEDISLEEKYLNVVGKPLSKKYPYQLPEMILRSSSKSRFSGLFVNSSGTCSVVLPSHISKILLGSSPIWGVKCLKCSTPVDIDVVICEKRSFIYDISCADIYFKCTDATCILLFYVCDGVVDCFDGSDEGNHCNLSRATNLLSQYVLIPCIVGRVCGDDDDNIIPIHSICDGVYDNSSLSQEHALCYRHMSDPPDMVVFSSKNNRVYVSEESILGWTRLCESPAEAKSVNKYGALINHSPIDTVNNHCYNLNTICKIRNTHEREKCSNIYMSKITQALCGVFSCPGMFKCYKHVCILMSSVCDGYYDCEAGDDEIPCPISSCPGLLKCRGENRCVSKEEICDQTVSCLYSMDDEVGCHSCHPDCECKGYSVSCTLSNSLHEVSWSGIDNIKGLKLKGLQQYVFVKNLYFRGLVYFNASFCGILNVVYILNQAQSVNTFIMIADISHNHITNTTFLESNIFINVAYLDLSFNQVYTIHYHTFYFLDNLIALILKGNPLRLVTLTSFRDSSALLMVDIQYIPVYDYSDSVITLHAQWYAQVQVKVSEPILCCVLSANISCISTVKTILCFGLFDTKIQKFSFYFLAVVTLLISIGLTLKKIADVKKIKKYLNRKKKFFFILLFNQSSSAVLTSIYLVGLLCADVASVNAFFWPRSHLCICLRALLYISLVSNIIFKSCLVIIVALQILYPFNHQCLWLKWTGLFSMLIWIVVLTTYFLNMFQQFELQEAYDILCSIGMCGINKPPVLLILICVVDFLLFSVCARILLSTFTTVGKNIENLNMPQNQKKKNMIIIFKISLPIATELLFQISIICLLTIKLTSITLYIFCQYIFLYVLPLHVIYSSIILLCRLK